MPIFKKNPMEKVFDPITGRPVESDEKEFLLILVDRGSESTDEGSFVALRGRRATFDYLTSTLGNYDLLNSYVLTGNIPLGKEVSLYSFLRYYMETKFQNSDFTTDDLVNYIDEIEYVDLDARYSREINA